MKVRASCLQQRPANAFDLDARIANKRRLEAELLTLLDERDGQLKDVIAVKQELSSVREEIERMEGRLRFLRDQVALTTITITAREDRNYTPQQAPTFALRIGGAWVGSLLAMREAGENLVIAAVAFAPWGLAACVVAIPFFMWLRRSLRPVVGPIERPATVSAKAMSSRAYVERACSG